MGRYIYWVIIFLNLGRCFQNWQKMMQNYVCIYYSFWSNNWKNKKFRQIFKCYVWYTHWSYMLCSELLKLGAFVLYIILVICCSYIALSCIWHIILYVGMLILNVNSVYLSSFNCWNGLKTISFKISYLFHTGFKRKVIHTPTFYILYIYISVLTIFDEYIWK